MRRLRSFPISQRSDPWALADQFVARQSNFLKNPLSAGPGVCLVCRGYAWSDRCDECQAHLWEAGGLLADAVVPIAYKITRGQHSHNLWAYKEASPPVIEAQVNLSALLRVFLREHLLCLREAAGGGFTSWAAVPSTKGRAGPHPLERLWSGGGLARIDVGVNPCHPPSSRTFHADWFHIVGSMAGHRALVIDDSWTTGSRAQSLAHALKHSGAESAVIVVMGRHLNADAPNGAEIIKRARTQPRFDIGRCALE